MITQEEQQLLSELKGQAITILTQMSEVLNKRSPVPYATTRKVETALYHVEKIELEVKGDT